MSSCRGLGGWAAWLWFLQWCCEEAKRARARGVWRKRDEAMDSMAWHILERLFLAFAALDTLAYNKAYDI